MTCREAANLLPLFLDGELDPRQMRAVALHSTRCSNCEQDIRHLERMQELISESVSNAVDEVDFENFWPAIEQRLSSTRQPWWLRLRGWWGDGEHGWIVRLPAFAAAAVIAALALLLFTHVTQPTSQPGASQLAVVDNATSIESLDTDVDSVAVLNDPETRTTVLWVNDVQANGDAP
ncbi:MAG: anti-sigma factor family protein [Candidatus Binatia bacterium]